VKYFRLHILIILLLIGAEPALSTRQTGYVSHFERIAQLEGDLASVRGANRQAILIELAEEHYQQAELYSLVWRSFAAIGKLYYNIMEDNDVDAGIASGLYRGIGYFELGMYDEAREAFQSLLRVGDRLPTQIRVEAEAWTGAVEYQAGNTQRAQERWNAMSESERTSCSIIAYVKARIGHNTGMLNDLCPSNQLTDQRDNIAFIQALVATDRFDLLPEVVKNKTIDAAFIEEEGSEGELRYFNPSEIVTLASAHYALAAHYAEKAGRVKEKRFYTGAFYFHTNRYDAAINELVGVDDLRSALYLAGAYYKTEQQSIAEEVFDYIERTGDDDIIRELNILYAMIGVTERSERADQVFKNRIDSQQTQSRRNVPQDIYKQLGLVYFYNEKYEEALDVLGAAFRTERRNDLRVNDPGFMILYGSSMVMAKNFISLSDAIEMFSTVMRAYPPVEALVETTSLIDVVTNIGREGRIIYRR